MRKPLKIQARMRHKETFNRLRTAFRGERLVSCAIIRDGEIHHGQRSHAGIRGNLGDKTPYEKFPGDQEGFYTSNNRFVTREQAKRIGEESGQCRPMARELLSSDINW